MQTIYYIKSTYCSERPFLTSANWFLYLYVVPPPPKVHYALVWNTAAWNQLNNCFIYFIFQIILLTFSQKQPPEVSCKKPVLKNFAILTGKHLYWNLFLKKLQTFKPATLWKKDSNTGTFLRILQNLTLILKNVCEGCFCFFNPFQSSSLFNIEASHLFFSFYMKCNSDLKWINMCNISPKVF